MSVFVSHSASEKAGHVVRTLTQRGLQTCTVGTHAGQQPVHLVRLLQNKNGEELIGPDWN